MAVQRATGRSEQVRASPGESGQVRAGPGNSEPTEGEGGGGGGWLGIEFLMASIGVRAVVYGNDVEADVVFLVFGTCLWVCVCVWMCVCWDVAFLLPATNQYGISPFLRPIHYTTRSYYRLVWLFVVDVGIHRKGARCGDGAIGADPIPLEGVSDFLFAVSVANRDAVGCCSFGVFYLLVVFSLSKTQELLFFLFFFLIWTLGAALHWKKTDWIVIIIFFFIRSWSLMDLPFTIRCS